MAELIRSKSRAVLGNLVWVGIAFAVFFVGNVSYNISLRDTQYFNGWILAACITLLMLLTIRKRIVILPFGRVRKWLLLHYYLGFATLGVFVVHSRYQFPNSALEWLLWTLFVLVAVSGLFGGWISKVIPPRLEAHGERLIFQRLPMFRAQIASQAEALAFETIEGGDSLSISKLYKEVLADFFARHHNIFAHLQLSNAPLVRLQGEMDAIERYLDEGGKAQLDRMRALVETKDNIDFHYANGGLLKLWLFFHIPATYAMIVAIVVHVVVAYAFATGIA